MQEFENPKPMKLKEKIKRDWERRRKLPMIGGDFRRGIEAGWEETKGIGSALKGLAGIGDRGEAFGDYEGAMRRAGELAPKGAETFEAVDDASEFAKWGMFQLGKLVPSMVGGGIGGIVGREVAKKTLGLGVRTAADVAARRAQKGLAQRTVDRAALDAVAKRERIGAALGAYAASAAQETGSIAGDIYSKTGEAKPLESVAGGAVAGALDAIPQTSLMGKILNPGSKVGGSVLGAGVKQGLGEGVTEAGQTIVENLAVAAGEGKDLLKAETLRGALDPAELKESFAVGMLGGGVLGAGAQGMLNQEQRTKGVPSKTPALAPPPSKWAAQDPVSGEISIFPSRREAAAHVRDSMNLPVSDITVFPLDESGEPAPAPDASVLASFLPESADLPDSAKKSLEKAKDLLDKNAAPIDIWAETGWILGPDNQWRFELPNVETKLKDVENPKTLGDMLEDPRLFRALPGLSKTPVSIQSTGDENLAAYYDPDWGEMVFSKDFVQKIDPEELRGIVLHETQHLIQEEGGLAQGSNPWAEFQKILYGMKPIDVAQYSKDISTIQAKDLGANVPEDEYLAALERIQKLETKAIDNYRRRVGEAEAFDVQDRKSMDEGMLRNIPPRILKDEDLLLSERVPLRSALEEAIKSLPMDSAQGTQILGFLQKKPGVSEAELTESRIKDFLLQNGEKKVRKKDLETQVREFVSGFREEEYFPDWANSELPMELKKLGWWVDIDPDAIEMGRSGKIYRFGEQEFELPEEIPDDLPGAEKMREFMEGSSPVAKFPEYSTFRQAAREGDIFPLGPRYKEIVIGVKKKEEDVDPGIIFAAKKHFKEPHIVPIVHLRMGEGEFGETLVQEIQSDAHQGGGMEKGGSPGILPLRKKWPDAAIRRAFAEAIANGDSELYFLNGELQAELAGDSAAETIFRFYNENLKNRINRILRKYGGEKIREDWIRVPDFNYSDPEKETGVFVAKIPERMKREFFEKGLPLYSEPGKHSPGETKGINRAIRRIEKAIGKKAVRKLRASGMLDIVTPKEFRELTGKNPRDVQGIFLDGTIIVHSGNRVPEAVVLHEGVHASLKEDVKETGVELVLGGSYGEIALAIQEAAKRGDQMAKQAIARAKRARSRAQNTPNPSPFHLRILNELEAQETVAYYVEEAAGDLAASPIASRIVSKIASTIRWSPFGNTLAKMGIIPKISPSLAVEVAKSALSRSIALKNFYESVLEKDARKVKSRSEAEKAKALELISKGDFLSSRDLLTHEERKAAFRNWFRDSKVRWEDGAPIIVFESGDSRIGKKFSETGDRGDRKFIRVENPRVFGSMRDIEEEILKGDLLGDPESMEIISKIPGETLQAIIGDSRERYDSSPEARAEINQKLLEASEDPELLQEKLDSIFKSSLQSSGVDGVKVLDGGITWIPLREDSVRDVPEGGIPDYAGSLADLDGEPPEIILESRSFGDFDIHVPENVKSKLRDRMIYYVQDQWVFLKRKQEEIERETGEGIPVFQDAYLAQGLYSGRVLHETLRFKEKELKPLLRKVADSGVELEDFGLWLYARHAMEANARLRRINAKRFLLQGMEKSPKKSEIQSRIKSLKESTTDGEGKINRPARIEGYFRILQEFLPTFPEKIQEKWEEFARKPSGMEDREARKILKFHSGNSILQEAGEMFDRMMRGNLDRMLASGLISEIEYESMRNAASHWVPLKRAGFEYESELGTRSKGISLSKQESRIRVGSSLRATNIFENAVASVYQTITRAEKQKVGEALLNLVRENPDPEFWGIKQIEMKPRLTREGTIQLYPDMAEEPNTILVKKNGKLYRIWFNPTDENAMFIARGLKNADTISGGFLNVLSIPMLWLSRVNTTLNPEFVLTNFVRDLGTTFFNLEATEGAELKGKIFNDVGDAIGGIRKRLREKEWRGDFWAELAEEYASHGATIGWSENYHSPEAISRSLEKMQKIAEGGNLESFLHSTMKFIEDYNTIFENAIRLSAYRHIKEKLMERGGKEEDAARKAAFAAKELTVNFNRHGAFGPGINMLYLFANAGIQGNAAIFRTLRTSKKAQTLLAGTIGFAVLLAEANRYIGGDDEDGIPLYDKIPTWVRDRNLVFILPEGFPGKDSWLASKIPGTKRWYVKIPMPWGYNSFVVMGDEIASAARYGDLYDWRKGATRMVKTIFEAFSPIQGANIQQLIMPTLLDPIYQIGANETFYGTKIHPEQSPFDKTPPPNYSLYWRTTSDFSKWLAKELSDRSFGDETKGGFFDFYPDTIDFWIDTVMGAAGRFVVDSGEIVVGLARDGSIPPIEQIPFARKILGTINYSVDRQIYQERANAVWWAEKRRRQTGEWSPPLQVLDLLKSTEKQLKSISKQQKQTKDQNRWEELEYRKNRLRMQFNDAFQKRVIQGID